MPSKRANQVHEAPAIAGSGLMYSREVVSVTNPRPPGHNGVTLPLHQAYPSLDAFTKNLLIVKKITEKATQ